MWGYIFGFLSSLIPSLGGILSAVAVQVGLSVGFGLITFTGMQILVDQAMLAMMNYLGGLPADVIQILGLMQFDTCLNIMFSAGVTLLSIKGMSKAGDFTRGRVGKE